MNALDAGVYTKLAGTSALTTLLGGTAIYNALAPQGADPPYCVFNIQASTPVRQMGGVAYENVLVQVQGVTIGESMKLAGQLQDAIDATLADQPVTVASHTLMYLRRDGGVSYTETVAGQRINHRGAIYRVMLDPA